MQGNAGRRLTIGVSAVGMVLIAGGAMWLEAQTRRVNRPKSASAYQHATQFGRRAEGLNPAAAELPRGYINTNWIPPSGRSLRVSQGDDLQAALNGAQRGDEIVLDAEATFVGSFRLPAKEGEGWIVVRSSALDRLPEGKRVGPADRVHMPKILAPGSEAAIYTEDRSTGWRLAGLEISTQPDVALNYALVAMGSGIEPTYDRITSNIVVDRSYIHGTPACQCRRGVAMHGAWESVIDSYISEIHVLGQDAQAIAGWNGPGPFKIYNNYLEGSGENIMFGGSDPFLVFRMTVEEATQTSAKLTDLPPFAPGTDIMFGVGGKTGQHAFTTLRTVNPDDGTVTFDELAEAPDVGSVAVSGVIPSDIDIRKNTLVKPLTWKVDHPSYEKKRWTVKNLFELKSAQRVLVDGNWMENSWADGQIGYSMLITSTNQDGGCPYCVTRDVTITNNVTKNTAHGIAFVGHQGPGPEKQPGTIQRVLVGNNLFYPSGRSMSIFAEARHLTFEHNTIFATANTGVTEGKIPNLVLTGNIFERPAYGLAGQSGEGSRFFAGDCTGCTWDRNGLINSSAGTGQDRSDDSLKGAYPAGTVVAPGRAGVGFLNLAGATEDHRGFALSPLSGFKGAGPQKRDLGVDFPSLLKALPDLNQ